MSSNFHYFTFLFLLFTYSALFYKSNALSCAHVKSAPHKHNSTVFNSQTFEKNKNIQCNLLMNNPKRIINRYKDELQNYVQSKPFSSVCLKCSMCLAIAREMDRIFVDETKKYHSNNQEEVTISLKDRIEKLCHQGFENYDLRKFNQLKEISAEFKCSSHVRSQMDGKWTEKLREICHLYSKYIDLRYLFNNYLKNEEDLPGYLCKNDGIFRDCVSLNLQNMTTLIKDSDGNFKGMCNK